VSAVTDLPPVGLDELVERAALLTRVDRKYVVPEGDVKPLVRAVAGNAAVLEIEGLRRFTYDSTYYDTRDLMTYHLAARKRRRRFKVRRRTYVDSATTFLEVKTRGRRKTTVKDRVPWQATASPVGGVGDGSAFIEDVLDRAGLDGVPVPDLVPALQTYYSRTTLLLLPPDGHGPASRVTLDTGLTWALPDGPRVLLPGLAVVETKSGPTPSAADRHLWSAGRRPVRVSKFGTGLAVLRPELPSTKWHPVLRRLIHPALAGARVRRRPGTALPTDPPTDLPTHLPTRLHGTEVPNDTWRLTCFA
jgi:hypothetical protein